jgi:hypothetical protein
MLSQDIDNAAVHINRLLNKINDGGAICCADLRGLQSSLRDFSDQARLLEARVALTAGSKVQP